MKYLVLIIYDEQVIYEKQMYLMHTQYLEKLNIDLCYYFVSFKNNLEKEVEINNNIIYIKGNESILNITKKTMTAIKYLFNIVNFIYDFCRNRKNL